MDEPLLLIEPLDTRHDRKTFTCGEPALHEYLQRQALQDVRRRVAQVFVAVGDAPEKILGYYTLSAASFQKEKLPPSVAKRLPHYPVPAAILGRLAIGVAEQGKRLGETLLLDAMRRVLRASTTVAMHAIVVDAKNDRARSFYERYGFKAFVNEPRRLFLPLETCDKLGL